MAQLVATPAGTERYELAEGPRFDAERGELVWVDIMAGRLLRADPDDLDVFGEITIDVPLGAVAPAASGGWVAAAGRGLSLLAADGTRTEIAELEPDGNRMNDGACDPQGRFWAGSMAFDGTPGAASLYRLDPSAGEVAVVLRGQTIANGLGWSPDGATMYHADTGPGTITAYDFDAATGEIERPRVVVRPEDAPPDGLTVDDEGLLWVALFGGSAVVRCDPATGREVARVELPVSQPTSCTFVGTRLVITTAARDVAEREPEAGRLFVAEVGVAGPPARQYVG
jgi:sugar lactone lactonase YvrE